MYIKQVFNTSHEWWRYLVGLLLIFIAVVIGQIPLTVAVMAKMFKDNMDLSTLDSATMMTALEPNLNFFLMILTYAIGLLGVFFVVKFLHNQSLLSLTTSRSKVDWNRFMFAFIFWGTFVTGMTGIEYLLNPDHYVLNFQLKPFLILAVIAVLFVPLQTSFEEYLFRGYLMQGIGGLAKNKWVPLILTSLLFGSLHFANPEIDKYGHILLVHYIGTGFFLGIITLMDEGLELALGFHAANNLFTALLVTADWTAFQTNSILKDVTDPEVTYIEIFFSTIVLYPLLILMFARVYKWNNWREKLFGKVTKC